MPDSKRPKRSPSPTSAPDLDILGDQVTIHPGGYIEPPPTKNDTHERNLVEHMARFRESPLDFLREVSLHVSGTGWRAYDDVVGQPIFYSGFTNEMKTAVMSTPILQRKISELAETRLAVEENSGLLRRDDKDFAQKRAQRKANLEESLQEVADQLTDRMICKFESKRFIRGAYYLCTQLLTRAYHQGMEAEYAVHTRSITLLCGSFLPDDDTNGDFFQGYTSPAKKFFVYAQ
jgi:hypothetical protein